MRRSEAVWMFIVSIVVLLFLLTGCGHSVPVPTPPVPPIPPLKVRFAWTSDGAPGYGICSPQQMPPCKVNFELRDETLGTILATLPMLVEAGQLAPTWMQAVPYYDVSLPATSSTHTFSLAVNAQAASAAIVQFPKAVTTIKFN
jgi:hypothetical protein